MKLYMSINDLIAWGLILAGVIFFIVILIAGSVANKISDIKSRREKKKREKEANGE